MSSGESHPSPALGFLTAVEHPQLGLFGGYLVLNIAGRPLEFHCTTPVKPNRAQQILYGPTLHAYLYGELIGQTLVNKAAATPLAVFCDVSFTLSLREFVKFPVALVTERLSGVMETDRLSKDVSRETDAGDAVSLRLDRPHLLPAGLHRFRLGDNELAIESSRRNDAAEIAARLDQQRIMDLSEPFVRIREALEEAQRGGR